MSKLNNLQDTWVFVSGNPEFVRQVWVRGVKKDRTAVLMSEGIRVRYFRVIHGLCMIVHHHRAGLVTTTIYWVGQGEYFGAPPMAAIMKFGVSRTLSIFCDSASKLKAVGFDSSIQYLPRT